MDWNCLGRQLITLGSSHSLFKLQYRVAFPVPQEEREARTESEIERKYGRRVCILERARITYCVSSSRTSLCVCCSRTSVCPKNGPCWVTLQWAITHICVCMHTHTSWRGKEINHTLCELCMQQLTSRGATSWTILLWVVYLWAHILWEWVGEHDMLAHVAAG